MFTFNHVEFLKNVKHLKKKLLIQNKSRKQTKWKALLTQNKLKKPVINFPFLCLWLKQ